MKLSDEWFSALSESDNQQLVIVTGRDHIHQFRDSGKFNERIEIRWKYTPDDVGMPIVDDARRMEIMEETLRGAMERDKLAILTAVYTGGGEKSWVFYTRTSVAFFETLNQALLPLEPFPLELYAERDPEWEEYRDMYEMKGWEEENV